MGGGCDNTYNIHIRKLELIFKKEFEEYCDNMDTRHCMTSRVMVFR